MRPRLVLALLASAALLGPVQAQTPIRMVLNWKYQGPQALFFLAEDKGYFKDADLAVTIDQGEGSAAAITKVATGAYDVGFGDINALISLSATQPDQAPIGIYQMFNTPPFTIAVTADSPIRKPADLVGKTIGGPASDGALKLFPAFAKAAGIDASAVTITNMQPNLREQMLMSGQVDGVFGYVNTIAFSAKAAGIDPDTQLRFVSYGDYGLDLYSNALVASKSFAAEHPEALKGLVAALNRATVDMIADPAGSVEAVMKREPLLNEAVEVERTRATLAAEMNHPEIGRIGLGAIDPDRMKRAIDVVVEANGLPRTPALEEVFTDAFLPPLAERPTKVVD
ncbi:ABC transporter substrate-binding protein [Aureimonas jatrophae]|uniref:Thiamine pyrimidine synthase n=1 Tax=Aureimonas jatrophae TaxID=1166073 RepID=A0A1H0DI90_9HYPH|nr:ABC transporter substrate-binding protein [Aureimonas jatrophae]MBB3951899.1 NitT/TauT family transport system substrate-binding protein [Aureimonas jatrophae]SDN69731.1 NitT/TauT family transport system substrate-binding protein [Aureimonas jatrophae]